MPPVRHQTKLHLSDGSSQVEGDSHDGDNGAIARGKQGCFTCRSRCKKCPTEAGEAGDGVCDECHRLRLECLGYGTKLEWLTEKVKRAIRKECLPHIRRVRYDRELRIAGGPPILMFERFKPKGFVPNFEPVASPPISTPSPSTSTSSSSRSQRSPNPRPHSPSPSPSSASTSHTSPLETHPAIYLQDIDATTHTKLWLFGNPQAAMEIFKFIVDVYPDIATTCEMSSRDHSGPGNLSNLGFDADTMMDWTSGVGERGSIDFWDIQVYNGSSSSHSLLIDPPKP